MLSVVRVAYTKKGIETSSGTGLLDSVSLTDAEHQPRLSALFHRIPHLRANSLVCSVCGPIRRSYWFCNHCHLSLCPSCWASWHYPEGASNTIAAASRTLCPSSSSCLEFRPPLHRPPFSQTVIAGGPNDLSHLHIPVVVVSILGIPAAGALPLSQSLEYTARDFANTAGYGCSNFRIPTNTAGSTLEALTGRVKSVCALVRNCYAGRYVLDLRAHAIGGKYEFSPHLFTTADLFARFILPITRAFRDAQRLTRGRYPAFDSSRAAVAASRILVVFHCCDTEIVTFEQMLDEFLESDGVAIELLLFQKPLLLKEMNIVLPSLMSHYTNALCPLSTYDMLEQTTSAAQRLTFVPTFLSPRPGSKRYFSRVLGAPSPAVSLANRLPPGGPLALSRRTDPYGAYASPPVELPGSPAASRSDLVSRSALPARDIVSPAHPALCVCPLAQFLGRRRCSRCPVTQAPFVAAARRQGIVSSGAKVSARSPALPVPRAALLLTPLCLCMLFPLVRSAPVPLPPPPLPPRLPRRLLRTP